MSNGPVGVAESRWIKESQTDAVVPEIDAFIRDIEAVCRKHGLSIGHEDGHGAFQIDAFNERDMEWLGAAHDARKLGRPRTRSGVRTP